MALIDSRIVRNDDLETPRELIQALPLHSDLQDLVVKTRREIEDILESRDDRLLVVMGPCSIHDRKAALEYADYIRSVREEFSETLCIVMRTYFAKPRTTCGWKGFLYDPDLNGENNIRKGLRNARKLLIDILSRGVPTSMEHVDTIGPQYFDDVLSWAAIGARTTESQIHRELASGISSPIGLKNGTGGSIQLAVNAVTAVRQPHRFLGCNKDGRVSSVETTGNPYAHIILRGGSRGPNYEASYIEESEHLLEKSGLPKNIVVDCSHGNSLKQHKKQLEVAENIGFQVATGTSSIKGVMVESNLHEGNQDISCDPLAYGTSITDACLHLEDSTLLLKHLQNAVIASRAHREQHDVETDSLERAF